MNAKNVRLALTVSFVLLVVATGHAAIMALPYTATILSTGGSAVAAVYGLTPSSSDTQIAATAGLRHKF